MWVAAAFLVLWAPSAWAAARLPDVLDARVTTTPERARLIVDLTGSTEFAIASLDSPERIAIDMKAQTVAISSPSEVNGSGLVSAFDTVLAEDGRARTELTLAQPAVVQQAYVLDPIGGQPARLIVDLIPTSDADFKQRAATDLARAMQAAGPDVAPPQPSTSAASSSASAASSVAAVTPAPIAVPLRPSVPATPGSRPLIVIDPGHGGID
ncbi:MAG TPA: AMIN domain-containing protein, partial [Devosia sp.]|nr:AMIN domain-containing protein [Devosia sp.]